MAYQSLISKKPFEISRVFFHMKHDALPNISLTCMMIELFGHHLRKSNVRYHFSHSKSNIYNLTMIHYFNNANWIDRLTNDFFIFVPRYMSYKLICSQNNKSWEFHILYEPIQATNAKNFEPVGYFQIEYQISVRTKGLNLKNSSWTKIQKLLIIFDVRNFYG